MALQDTYSDSMAAGYSGMVANGETSNRLTRTIEDASGIGFGKAAFLGAGDHGCTATPTAGALLGITISHQFLAPSAAPDVYPQYANVAVMTQGAIFVNASAAVADGAQAYVAANGDISSTNTGTILPGWFFDGTTTAAGLVKLAKR